MGDFPEHYSWGRFPSQPELKAEPKNTSWPAPTIASFARSSIGVPPYGYIVCGGNPDMHITVRGERVSAPSRRRAAKVWNAHLRRPLGVRGDGSLSVQLPAGEYQLSEHDDIHYALYVSREFSVILRVTELDHLRAMGDLVIDGAWP